MTTQIAHKTLVGSLAYAGMSGAEPTPIPATGDWSHAATVGTIQQVSALAAAVAPDWTELVATGWEPADPLMTIITVTGTITTSTSGQPASSRPFSLALTVGGARHHPGYGAVAVSAWTET